MRMSDTVTVNETSETMRGLETEESSSAPGDDCLSKPESREHVEPNGEENCYDEKSEAQVQSYETCTPRSDNIGMNLPHVKKYVLSSTLFKYKQVTLMISVVVVVFLKNISDMLIITCVRFLRAPLRERIMTWYQTTRALSHYISSYVGIAAVSADTSL